MKKDKITITDLRKLSTYQLKMMITDLERIARAREEEKDVETVTLIYYDDGCEGSYIKANDEEEFKVKARNKDEYGNDLVDYLAADMFRYGDDSQIILTQGIHEVDSVRMENFLGEDNPYYIEEEDDDFDDGRNDKLED